MAVDESANGMRSESQEVGSPLSSSQEELAKQTEEKPPGVVPGKPGEGGVLEDWWNIGKVKAWKQRISSGN